MRGLVSPNGQWIETRKGKREFLSNSGRRVYVCLSKPQQNQWSTYIMGRQSPKQGTPTESWFLNSKPA